MGTYRKRWNEKARSGQLEKLKKLKKIRNKQFTKYENNVNENSAQQTDSNSEILCPLTNEEKELKKRKLQELFIPNESKISRNKKKRLDKFIEHQLKREEKKIIIEKLQDYKMDPSMLTSSKKLGHGRQTKKEEFIEALKLEKTGRENEQVKNILYEEYEVKNWDEDYPNIINDSQKPKNCDTDAMKTKHFIDHEPNKHDGSGFSFGFANIKVINQKKHTPRKYNWRERVEMEERKAHKLEDDMDFESSSNDDESSSDESSNENIQDSPKKDTILLNKNSDNSVDSFIQKKLSESNDSESPSSELTDSHEIENFHPSKCAEEFKEWANKEIKRIEGRDSDLSTPKLNVSYKPIIREEDLNDGLHEDYIPIDENAQRKAFFVRVERSDEIQQKRMQLPVFAEEHKIMEAIHHNDVVIICGETGSGKTTQIPQFLFESGYGHSESPDTPGMIGITQPRRVAAISMAERVSKELGNFGNQVAHQVRFNSTNTADTRIKFMTDGVLLREMMNDFRLTKYSSIIIDEAHERNINTDILIGLLSRCVKLRAKEYKKNPTECKKLKLIIMSATLRVSDFSENPNLFSAPPPVLKIDSRQYSVSIHFNRRTAYDYAEEAFRKTCKIHRKLPPGAILVFMTGQQEITHMVKRLRAEFPFANDLFKKKGIGSSVPTIKINPDNADVEVENIDFSVDIRNHEIVDDCLDSDTDDNDIMSEEGFDETLEDNQSENDPLYVLPLYSLLPEKEQMKVFQDPPKGSRLCVVATNIAETSLTIPGVRYVVDCGRSKERKFNESNGVQSFEVSWISKSSASQRSGRAGRTGPGHCYRLYSSAVYERDFEHFSKPEILRMPVESVILQMKSMAIHNVINFPFVTPPDKFSLAKAIKLLQYLGALDEKENITEDGKRMSLFPLSPRFSKILLVGGEKNCLPYIVTIVSALSVGDPFINEYELGLVDKCDNHDNQEFQDTEYKKELRLNFYKKRAVFSKLDKYSDVLKLLCAVSSVDYISKESRQRFLESNFLRPKLIDEIINLRKQVMYIIRSNTSKEGIAVSVKDEDLKMGIPSNNQIKLLKQMICAGFVDQVVIRADQLFPDDAKITHKTSIINIPYIPVLAHKSNNISQQFVYIHPTSIINNLGEEPPKYLIYHSLHLSNNTNTSKTRMKLLCDIKSTPLANVARKGSLLTYSKELTGQGINPIYISPTEKYCFVTPRFGESVDNDLKIGWELNPIPVHQRKKNGKWIVTKIITSKDYKETNSRNNR